jgi:hypothetical protein
MPSQASAALSPLTPAPPFPKQQIKKENTSELRTSKHRGETGRIREAIKAKKSKTRGEAHEE